MTTVPDTNHRKTQTLLGSAKLRYIGIAIARGQGDSLTKEAKINSPLVAPLALHAPVGQYVVKSGDEVVARVPLVTLAKVDEGGLWRTTVDAVKLWFE